MERLLVSPYSTKVFNGSKGNKFKFTEDITYIAYAYDGGVKVFVDSNSSVRFTHVEFTDTFKVISR